jgi:hypothetical protein
MDETQARAQPMDVELRTYYTDDRIRDTLLQGIADSDIRREALSVKGIQ